MTGQVPAGWLARAEELLSHPDPAWRERGQEILNGDL